MFTKRRTPFSSSRRSFMPGCFFSRFSMTCDTVPPSIETCSSPAVRVRSGVGMRTVTGMGCFLSGGTRGAGVSRLVGVEDAPLRSAERTRGARRDGNGPEAVRHAVVSVNGAGGTPVSREQAEREIGHQRAGKAHHGAEHARFRAVRLGVSL